MTLACGEKVGTTAGSMRHYRAGETPCEACRVGRNSESREHKRTPNRKSCAQVDAKLSDEEYADMLEAQDGRCAICRRTPAQAGRRQKRLALDHDHTSGRTRKLLCHGCNTGLGLFGEDEARLLAAVDYLREYTRNPATGQLRG